MRENRLYIIEGADGTGKSTLSKELLEETKGHLLHGTYDKDWDIKRYHDAMFASAMTLLQYQDVTLDRWAASEEVYSEAFRGGRLYSADAYMIDIISNSRMSNPQDIKYIYCSNDNTIENHELNMQTREEMFSDMSPVVREYEKYISNSPLDWITYDFDKVNMKEFVKEITQ